MITDLAIDVEVVQRRTHGVHGGLVGGLLVATAHQLPGGDGGDLGHPRRVQHQTAVKTFRTHVGSVSSLLAQRLSGWRRFRQYQMRAMRSQ